MRAIQQRVTHEIYIMSTWDFLKLQELIAGQVEENLNLDYKAADALQNTPGKRKEITKDVSAMANSAGGTIIYGIAEHSDPTFAHVPEKIDPVSRTNFSKETLEHVIGNIHPRIKDIIIHPVSVPDNPDNAVYVVQIPQSTTAHQAQDKRYYKRFNFESVAMDDYEIRDVMFRQAHPVIDIEFVLRLTTRSTGRGPISSPFEKRTTFEVPRLSVSASNTGSIYAQYVNVIVTLPAAILWENWIEAEKHPAAFREKTQIFTLQNTRRDVISYAMYTPKYGPSRFDPLLPGMKFALDDIDFIPDYEKIVKSDVTVKWSLFADNAPPSSGVFHLNDLKVIDERKQDAC